MSWGGGEGPIIGMKKRERELKATHRDLEAGLRVLIHTLKERGQDAAALPSLMTWTTRQLETLLRGGDIQPFPDDG